MRSKLQCPVSQPYARAAIRTRRSLENVDVRPGTDVARRGTLRRSNIDVLAAAVAVEQDRGAWSMCASTFHLRSPCQWASAKARRDRNRQGSRCAPCAGANGRKALCWASIPHRTCTGILHAGRTFLQRCSRKAKQKHECLFEPLEFQWSADRVLALPARRWRDRRRTWLKRTPRRLHLLSGGMTERTTANFPLSGPVFGGPQLGKLWRAPSRCLSLELPFCLASLPPVCASFVAWTGKTQQTTVRQTHSAVLTLTVGD